MVILTQTSGKSSTDTRIPPLKPKITLESSPLKSTMLVGRLGVDRGPPEYGGSCDYSEQVTITAYYSLQ